MNTHTNPSPLSLQSAPVLAWEGLTRPVFERTKRWYTVAGAIVVLCTGYAIVTGAWSFAVVCVLACGMFVLVRDHVPHPVKVELHDSGVLFDGDFVRWDELSGFWILATPGYTELRFVPKRRAHRMSVQTAGVDLAQLRMVLGQRIQELTEKRESLLDVFIRLGKI